jgi:1,4-alpha-glucan branching enzyme
VRDLKTFYRGEAPLYEVDFEPFGFEWIDCNDTQRSVISFIRWAKNRADMTMVVLKFTPIPRENYRLGALLAGCSHECLNSDAPLYGGSGQWNIGGVEAGPSPARGRPYSLGVTLPPPEALFPRHSRNLES